jgi:hypothetical protein
MAGLPDFCILGSADHHLALALIGQAEYSVPAVLTVYREMILALQKRLHVALHGDLLGFVPGTILHSWYDRILIFAYLPDCG